jgi:hypothetical protein
MLTRIVDVDEGLDPSSLTRCLAVLPEDIMSTQLDPPYHKLDPLLDYLNPAL